jgi:predicted RNA binding protein YcfA (HicA-like mRNA interferase family)
LPKLRRLSSKEILSILRKFGFEVLSQKGSHIKVGRFDDKGNKQTITIPKHKSLDTGTCYAIYRQASEYILESDLRPYFYTD